MPGSPVSSAARWWSLAWPPKTYSTWQVTSPAAATGTGKPPMARQDHLEPVLVLAQPSFPRRRESRTEVAHSQDHLEPVLVLAQPSFPRRRESRTEAAHSQDHLEPVLVLYPFEDDKHGSPSVIPAEADLRTTVIPAEAGIQNGGSTLSRPSGVLAQPSFPRRRESRTEAAHCQDHLEPVLVPHAGGEVALAQVVEDGDDHAAVQLPGDLVGPHQVRTRRLPHEKALGR